MLFHNLNSKLWVMIHSIVQYISYFNAPLHAHFLWFTPLHYLLTEAAPILYFLQKFLCLTNVLEDQSDHFVCQPSTMSPWCYSTLFLALSVVRLGNIHNFMFLYSSTFSYSSMFRMDQGLYLRFCALSPHWVGKEAAFGH